MSTPHRMPMPRFPQPAGCTRIEELAAMCIGGMPEAGIDLVHRLWAHGVTDDDTLIRGLVQIACPTLQITVQAFDRLADALTVARELEQLAHRDTVL